MGRVVYEVPLVTQAQNPICWVACMAMIASERRGYSVGVSAFADGQDPSNSSIPNPCDSRDRERWVRRFSTSGFTLAAVNPDATEIETLLRTCGPFMLNHFCAGFPYGAGWGAPAAGAGHAVVITGIDSGVSGGMCWMNNPWGNKDRPILTSAVIAAIVAWLPTGAPQCAYWTQ